MYDRTTDVGDLNSAMRPFFHHCLIAQFKSSTSVVRSKKCLAQVKSWTVHDINTAYIEFQE